MKDETLPYFLTNSPTYAILKSLTLHFFPILKSFILLLYKTNKPLLYKLLPFRPNYLANVFFKVIQHGCETFQNAN